MNQIQILISQGEDTKTALDCIETEAGVTLDLAVTIDGENIPIPMEEMYSTLETFAYGLGSRMSEILQMAEEHFNPTGIVLPPKQPDLFGDS